MRVLSNGDCLHLWERGRRLHPLDQGLLALGAALPETPYEELGGWPLGRCHRALVELHCASFGPALNGQLSCPECGEKLEFRMDVRALLEPPAQSIARIEVGDYEFRPPSPRDLARAAREPDPQLAARKLIQICRTDNGDPADWRENELEEIGEKMSEADPLAEIRLNFACARCGHEWQENLDLATFLWIEIEARSKRLLFDVHTLAVAYGWSEAEVLSLSEPRRARYLEMVRA